VAITEKIYSTYANGVRVVGYGPRYDVQVTNESAQWERAYHCAWDYLANARKAAKILSLGRAKV